MMNPGEASSLSFSRRYFNLRHSHGDDEEDEVALTYKRSSHSFSGVLEKQHKGVDPPPRRKKQLLKSLLGKSIWTRGASKVTGTVFGYRRGHVRIAFQETPKSRPWLVMEISTTTGSLVKQLASGMVRVALECDKKRGVGRKLLEEPLWRAYCNGHKCGPATRQECGAHEIQVLAAVGPTTMGAGVLPGGAQDGAGELMYLRAVFERVAGSSKDSEAFYMINPNPAAGSGTAAAPELTLFFRRV